MTFSTARRGAGVLTEPPGLTVPVRGLRGLHGPPPPHRHPVIAGAASLGIRESIDHRRRPARVIAAFPSAVYLEVETSIEPRVVAVVASDAVRLPSAVVIAATTRQLPFETVREGDTAMVGDGAIDITRRFQVRVRRWWDPTPVLGPISLARLAHGAAALESVTAGAHWGLTGHRDPRVLAECCASGDLAGAVDAAERIVGLGPGLTPSGDDALCGLLLALRLLGGAVPQCSGAAPRGARAAPRGAGTVAQGSGTVAQGAGTVAQGAGTVAQGAGTVAQGAGTVAQGAVAVPQGSGTVAQGAVAVPQGSGTVAQGAVAVPQGSGTVAQGAVAVPQGSGTVAQGSGIVAQGSGVGFGAGAALQREDARRGGTSVWLADWLGAAVTAHAGDRTTALAATLLHCAARGQASVEVAGVLRGIAGQEPVLPAVRRLLSTGHTSGADLAWGLLAGCRAALSLSTRQDLS